MEKKSSSSRGRSSTLRGRGSRSKRQPEPRLDNVEEEDNVRSPDPIVSQNQLFHPDQMMGDDHELWEAIQKSRQEYMDIETKEREDREHCEELKTRLAVPLSRLRLWEASENNKDERQCVRTVLDILGSLTTYPHVSPVVDSSIIPELQSFLHKIENSKLYNDVATQCLQWLETQPRKRTRRVTFA